MSNVYTPPYSGEDQRREADAIRRRDGVAAPLRLRVATTVVSDVLAVLVATAVALFVGAFLTEAPLVHRLFDSFEGNPSSGALLFVLLTPYWVLALWAFGQYHEPGRSIGGMSPTSGMEGLTALTVAGWLLLIVMVLVKGVDVHLAKLIAFWALAVVTIPVFRWITRQTVWAKEELVERVLVIGAGEVGHTVAAKMDKHPEYRVELVGFLDDGEPRTNGYKIPRLQILGALTDLGDVIHSHQVDRVVVAFSKARHGDLLTVVRTCADAEVQVNIVPRLYEVVSSRALVDDVEGIPLLDIGNAQLSPFNMFAKRVFDLLAGGVLLVLLAPLLAVIALIVKLDSSGPVFYRQERMGRGGRTFRIFKFRSMFDGAEKLRLDLAERNDYSGPMFKMKEDPRITRAGAWLRRTSLDELPQIFNVLKGEMSLVGPRPLWVDEAKQCRGWTQKRLDITPGITGLWQVLGRNDIPFDEMVKLDYMYVTGWSLSWDIKLLFQTVPAVLNKRGAY